jgi:hypothetical protein
VLFFLRVRRVLSLAATNWVSEKGGDLSIERATDIGQVPLKYIDHALQGEDAAFAAKRDI